MMKTLLALVALLILSLGAPAQAQSYSSLRHAGNFGLGLGAGTYGGGLSAKYWISDATAVQGTVSGSGSVQNGKGHAQLTVNADYLLEMPNLADPEGLEIAWNIGPGVGLQLQSDDGEGSVGLGISGVVGLEFDLTVIPLDVVLEYRPVFVVSNGGFGFNLTNFGGQVRYYFG